MEYNFRLALSLKRTESNEPYGRFSYLLTTGNSFKTGQVGEMLKSYREIDEASALAHFTKKLNKYFFKRLDSKRHINVDVDEELYHDLKEKMIDFQENYDTVHGYDKEYDERRKIFNVIVNIRDFKLFYDVSYKTVNNKMFYA